MDGPIDKSVVNLIVVPGHAIYNGTSGADAYFGAKWLGMYTAATGYKYDDEAPLYVRHIQRGINLANSDPKAVLVFSGGKTRRDTTKAEAESYWELADQLKWFSVRDAVEPRALLECFARDSFENLLLSIQLFQSLHLDSKYPRKVTVIGLQFKEARFRFHADTIISRQFKGIEPFVFRYDGVNEVPDYVLDAGSREGEELTLQQFHVWPLGDGGDLQKKRNNRDPHRWFAGKPYP